MNLTLDTSAQYVPRVGPMMAAKIARLGIVTVRDLLYYVPFRYNDFSNTIRISRLQVGVPASIKGTVESIKNIFTKTGKRLQECVVSDGTGTITVIWFNQLYLPKVIHEGDAISLSGPVGFFGNKKAMESPEYELAAPGKPFLHTGRIVGVYSETAGVSSKWIRARIYFLLTAQSLIQEYLPQSITDMFHLQPLDIALHDVHFPKTMEEGMKSRRRLAFDELLFMQCRSFEQKRLWKETKQAVAIPSTDTMLQTFMDTLPFTLTSDQKHAVLDVANDLKQITPMNRLLEGDVGSGKTVVATAAMYIASKSGYQSVLMAPTQILAEQHYNTISKLLKPFGVIIGFVTGNSKFQISNFKFQILIGTHALLEDKIAFEKVGFVVIDEQQRFGVYQRGLLRSKGKGKTTPHLLTITATPIPRTLALTLYGNLDLSTLKEMPIGRKVIKTWVVLPEKRDSAYAWVEKEMTDRQSQAFILCPFIEESESMTTVKAATKEFEKLKLVYPNLKLGLLHGRMKAKEKTVQLNAFRTGTIDLLVATPVVEVGIDIPNATIMLIEGADRFGLAQLHQLRGRVGRSDKQSYCLLFTESTDERSIGRLKLLESVHNGPDLAEYDLTIRGSGDLFGARQHGIPAFAIASLADDQLVSDTKRAVAELTREDRTFDRFPLLRERLDKSTIDTISND